MTAIIAATCPLVYHIGQVMVEAAAVTILVALTRGEPGCRILGVVPVVRGRAAIAVWIGAP